MSNNQLLKDKKEGILALLEVKEGDKVFKNGSGSETNYDPTVIDWLEGIAKGQDILSSQDSPVSDSMGRFNINEETGKHEGLIRFEARNEGDNFPTIDEIDDHAKRHFDKAKSKRGRSDGTGLE